MQTALIWAVPVLGIIGVVTAFFLARSVLARDTGTPEMQKIGRAIFEGATAYLRRQYQTIGLFAIVAAILLTALITGFSGFSQGWHTGVAFLIGAAMSGISGFIGMFVAVQANQRTASAARRSLNEALTVALRAGAVSGLLVVSLSLLGVLGIFYIFGGASDPGKAPFLIIGYAFGASFVALFAQLGGGIYTKAADVGADLVGKVEAGLPEDDPRNPAVIADLVGDNVGDCAGRGADLFESTAAENIGAMVLGVALFEVSKTAANPNGNVGWIFFPLIVLAFGLLASIIGVLVVNPRGTINDPMSVLNRGFYVTAGLSIIFMVFISSVVIPEGKGLFAICGLLGIAMSLVFVYITQYYTSGTYYPVRQIAEASKTGPATNIISGLAIGFETTGMPAVTISVVLFAAYKLGEHTGVASGGIFGTAVATMGMLMGAGYILAMDSFGPITDNAGGIVELSDQPEAVRDVTDALDSAGNTTKALTKGYAVGSAALAAFLLFSAYLDEVGNLRLTKANDVITSPTGQAIWNLAHQVNLGKVEVFIGGFLGAMLIFLFSSFAIRAVGRAAGGMITEVRRQWRENPGILEGTVPPDYAACVDISVRSALREMVVPGLLAVAVPVIVGVLLKSEAAAGMLMVGTMVGVLMANVLNNGGGAWDNAKKFIEAGNLKDDQGNTLRKGSEPHAAAVVGDTVGDPFKDTAGPSLHVLIKLLATITLVLAPLFVR
ncbi:MAG: sodium-translocating pyrophosphatase [Thermomicrobiales bacterium]